MTKPKIFSGIFGGSSSHNVFSWHFNYILYLTVPSCIYYDFWVYVFTGFLCIWMYVYVFICSFLLLFFSLCLFCLIPDWSYFIVIFTLLFVLLKRDRKGIDLDGRGGGENLKEGKTSEYIAWRKSFINKRKIGEKKSEKSY